jgi:hypothetical protein
MTWDTRLRDRDDERRAWPSISDTSFAWTPRPSMSVAAVCRRSWNRTRGQAGAFEQRVEGADDVGVSPRAPEDVGEHEVMVHPVP